MNRIFTNLIKRTGLVIASAAVAAVSLGSLLTTPASALSVSASNDCDANAVVYCGADSTEQLISKYASGDGRNSAASIQAIYSYFGIDATDVNALNTTAVAGAITRGGNVYINGRTVPVASGATTAGRQNIQGSTVVTRNGETFYVRKPSLSFTQAALPAYVVMKNGVFQFAIIANCGNPVLATPPPAAPTPKHPGFTVTKEVAVKGTTQFSTNVTVPEGTHVIYRITVASTGDAPVQNMVLSDVLPAGITYVPGTFTADSFPIDDSYAQQLFNGSLNVGEDPNGETDNVTFEAIVGTEGAGAKCQAHTIDNHAVVTATGLPNGNATATVNETCKPAPVTPAAAVTTPPAKTLPNTGAGGMIGMFAGLSTLGALAYRYVVLRRLAQ